MPQVPPSNLPRVRAPFDRSLRMGAPLLRSPASTRKVTAHRSSHSRLPLDSNHRRMLEIGHSVLRGPLPREPRSPRVSLCENRLTDHLRSLSAEEVHPERGRRAGGRERRISGASAKLSPSVPRFGAQAISSQPLSEERRVSLASPNRLSKPPYHGTVILSEVGGWA